MQNKLHDELLQGRFIEEAAALGTEEVILFVTINDMPRDDNVDPISLKHGDAKFIAFM